MNTFISFFDSIRVINLPERTDRRRAISIDLERFGMPLEPGKVEIFRAIRPAEAGPFPSIGTRGCFLSHLEVFKEAKAAGVSRLLVIEDDLQISRRFPQFEEAFLDVLHSKDWGIAYFGHALELPPSSTPMVVFEEPVLLAHFYGVNGAILGRLIEFLEQLLQRPLGHPDGGPMHFDGALTTFRNQNRDLLTLVANPSVGRQRSSRTDIHPLRWFDRTPVIRDLVATARRGKCWITAQY